MSEDFQPNIEEWNNEEEEELFVHHKIIVDKGQAQLRIDKFLINRLENVSRNKLQNIAEAGNILVNEKPVKSNYKVKPLDVITIVLTFPPRDREIKPEKMDLNIVYEDDDLLVINKQAGLVVHPGHGNYSGTLVNGLMHHFSHLPMFSEGEIRPGLVHRIDKNTSGIMIVAKNEFNLAHLAKQFFDRTTKRTYIALVWGDFEEESGTITGNIGRSLKDRLKMAVFPNGEFGKHAVTHYKVLERFGYVTLIECKLETGRTHQIRAHLEYIGHPLFNDERYGGNKILRGTTFNKYRQYINNCFEMLPRHALHAKSLGFIHPKTKKEMFFDSEIAQDMQNVIEKWRNYSENRNIDNPND
jgi:23S rRNA pseudouridine1911/1915/1917 synthase